MADENIKQVMQDAILDADSLEQFINGSDSETVLTRLSAQYPTLQKAIKQMFENGGLPATPFKTKADMEASELADGSYAVVTDDGSNNNLYIKEGGVWVKSEYFDYATSDDYILSLVKSGLHEYVVGKDSITNTVNLYNDDAPKTADTTINVEGELIPNSTVFTTDFIPVKPSTDYTVSQVVSSLVYMSVISFYNAKKDFIGRYKTSSVSTAGYESFETPTDCYYVRITTQKGSDSVVKRMLYEGVEQIPYEKFKGKKLSKDLIPNEAFDALRLERRLDDYIIGEGLVENTVNLYNDDTPKTDGHILDDGSLSDSSANFVTDFIKVEPDTEYTASQIISEYTYISSVAFYDRDKNFIGRSLTYNANERINISGYFTVTTPDNCFYVRLNCQKGFDAIVQRMFYKGSEHIDYVKHNAKTIKADALPLDALKDMPVVGAMEKDEQNVLDFLKRLLDANIIGERYLTSTVNLYNDNAPKMEGYFNAEGEVVYHSSQYTSDYIEVKPNTEYTAYQAPDNQIYIHGAVFFNSEKQFIGRHMLGHPILSSKYMTLTTPLDCVYVRLYCHNGNDAVARRMFYEGSEPIPYQKFVHKKVSPSALPDELFESKQRRGDYLSFTGDRHPAILLDFPDSYTINDDRAIVSGTEGQVTYEDMTTWWQSLVDEYPEYVTKEKIGTDSSGQFDVHSYTFSNPVMVEDSISPHAKYARPRVLMVVQHIEQMNQLYPYLAMRELCKNWQNDPALASLFLETEIVVIPYAHPWGFTYEDVPHGSYRMTSEGLNTNGDWPMKWSHVESPPNGDAPFATQEARNVKAVVESFKPHVLFDLHSAFGREDMQGMWIEALVDGSFVNSAREATTSFYPKFKAKFPDSAAMDRYLHITYKYPARILSTYGYAMGCTGGLIEFMKGFNNRPTSEGLYNDGLIFASSMLLNMTISCIAQYRDHGYPNPYPLYNGVGIYDPENGLGI